MEARSKASSPWRTAAADALIARLCTLMILGHTEVPLGHAVAVLRAEGLALTEARATTKFAVESGLVLLKARSAESLAAPALFVEANLADAHVQTAFINAFERYHELARKQQETQAAGATEAPPSAAPAGETVH